MSRDDWAEAAGFGVAPGVLDQTALDGLRQEAARLFATHGRRPAGVRAVLRLSPMFAGVAASQAVRSLVEPVIGAGAFVARSILFDKTPESNWDVAWHRDTTIAVEERVEVEGFGPWSEKAGVAHVRPSSDVLRSMLTARIHLDDCGAHNGALLVVPGSHAEHGETPAFEECEARAHRCDVAAGGAVLMRPLILHASKKATVPGHRRVLHLEFAAGDLPAGLKWARA